MAKKKSEKKENLCVSPLVSVFRALQRNPVLVPHRTLSEEFETVQGQEQSVRKLFDDYVAGRLDPRQLGGGIYDDDGSDEVDPLNTFGLTFEEASQISDAGRTAANEVEQRMRKFADHPRESSEKQEKEEKPDPSED